MKRVLFIAYYFPPIGGSGTQRPVKFVKYLPQLGWQPYVISTDRPYGDGAEGRDETLLADIPAGVQVWRVPTPQPRPVQRLARWMGWRPAMSPVASGPMITTADADTAPQLSWATRLRRGLLAPLYLIEQPPVDAALYWSLRIVPLARRIIEKEGIDVVLTTAAPWSALLAGRLLRQISGRPWIADFRDPWTDNTLIYFPTPAQRRVDARLERYLIDHTDALISVTDPVLAGLRQKASLSARDKPFVTITNGWDQSDFSDLPAIRDGLPHPDTPDGRVVLLHPGSAYQGEPLPLLAALDRLAADGTSLNRLRFHFVGYMHPEDRARIAASAHSRLFRLDPKRVPHDEAVKMMRAAHVLLLLLRQRPDFSSGKIFEYMVAGRPVLTIGAAKAVSSQLVEQCRIGLVLNSDDVAGLAHTLRQIDDDYPRFVFDNYHPDWSAIETYERRSLTGILASTLDRVCNLT